MSNGAGGPVVLITGGASGVGRIIAAAFVEAGYGVHVLDASAGHIDDFLAALPSASAALCDIGDASAVDAAMAAFGAQYGALDVLVNNAGIAGPTAAVEQVEVADWDRCLTVNLGGTFYVTRRAVPLLRARGAIVNIASNAGLAGCPNRSPYVASKWAMIGLTRTWAMELGPHGIRVNAVCPTSVDGERIEGVIARDAERRGTTPAAIRAVYERQSSMRTFVSADDVAATVLFLASDAARKISGQAIAVDGHTETLANWLDP